MFPYHCNFIKCFRYNKSFCSKTKKVQLRQLHPLSDSGGIQTHDLQNFFSTKSFCSKNKKVQLRQLNLILYAAEAGDLRYEKGAVETTAPLVIPVGFKPTTFRTFSRPSLYALKIKKVQPQKDAPKKVIPVGFKPTTFRTGI